MPSGADFAGGGGLPHPVARRVEPPGATGARWLVEDRAGSLCSAGVPGGAGGHEDRAGVVGVLVLVVLGEPAGCRLLLVAHDLTPLFPLLGGQALGGVPGGRTLAGPGGPGALCLGL